MPALDRPGDDTKRYIEVWSDLVSTKDLTVSLLICCATTIAALLVALAIHSSEFFWGLGGAVVGFVIAAVVVTPKRVVEIIDADATDAAAAREGEAA